MNVPQPTVSRVISQLEDELGAPLFTRTTRAVNLTEAGSDFLVRVQPILAELEEAEQAIRGGREMRGVLKIGLSSSLALREIAPRIPDFMQRHPKLRVGLMTDDNRQDFVSEGVNIGLRFGPLTDSTATAKRIGQWSRVIVGAPSYLARAGVPKTPDDLTAHSIIVTPSQRKRAWTFKKKGKKRTVTINGRLVVTLNEVGFITAIAGLGLVSMTSGAVRKELASGALVQVLDDWDMGEIELNAVFPAGKAAKPAARAFAAYLLEEFAKDPGLNPPRRR
ncbi:MAG: LysR family transcriptional regulator [Bradyrhizobium sp.]|nr:LysR family transcriptional regulator [Bradyrhizobium sp.]